jgi:hypothetical protein
MALMSSLAQQVTDTLNKDGKFEIAQAAFKFKLLALFQSI